jgi:pimeloyl-ACP methyl ester carboxylesterase
MRRAMLVPGVAGAAVEHLAWLGRSPWRADGRRHREALAVPLRTPVLQIAGDGDTFIPPGMVADAREHCLDDYRLVTLPAVGHYPAEESPEIVTRLIAEFAGASVRRAG